jgi:energy-coupling factor transporter ATP-binding protein EcfA2
MFMSSTAANPTSPRLPSIKPGTRTTIAGRTGSGKTRLARYLMEQRSTQHWVIFNPKHTSGYNEMSGAIVLRKWEHRKFDKAIEKHRFVVLNFAANELNHEYMDAIVQWIHENYEDIGFCFDELYFMHRNMEPGEGMVGLYTRGRERKQSVLGLVQRPKRISLFCFSEADYIGSMSLNLEMDRKRMVEATGNTSFMLDEKSQPGSLDKFHWRWYNVDADTAQLWGPVPLR